MGHFYCKRHKKHLLDPHMLWMHIYYKHIIKNANVTKEIVWTERKQRFPKGVES